MRRFLIAGLAFFVVSWAGGLSCAQEEPQAHDPATHVEGPGEEPTGLEPGEINAAGEEHGEHPPLEDGDNDGVKEDYDQPPLKEWTAVRFLWALGVFVALVFVMRKIAWEPLITALDAREARVNKAHAVAAAARMEIQNLVRQHEARIAEAQDEVQGIVAAARQEAERAKSEIIAEAEAETRDLQERSIAEIREARDEALGQLSQRVDEYTDLATEHIVGRVLRN